MAGSRPSSITMLALMCMAIVAAVLAHSSLASVLPDSEPELPSKRYFHLDMATTTTTTTTTATTTAMRADKASTPKPKVVEVEFCEYNTSISNTCEQPTVLYGCFRENITLPYCYRPGGTGLISYNFIKVEEKFFEIDIYVDAPQCGKGRDALMEKMTFVGNYTCMSNPQANVTWSIQYITGYAVSVPNYVRQSANGLLCEYAGDVCPNLAAKDRYESLIGEDRSLASHFVPSRDYVDWDDDQRIQKEFMGTLQRDTTNQDDWQVTRSYLQPFQISDPLMCMQTPRSTCVPHPGQMHSSHLVAQITKEFMQYDIYWESANCTGRYMTLSTTYLEGSKVCMNFPTAESSTSSRSLVSQFNIPLGFIKYAPGNTDCSLAAPGVLSKATGTGCLPLDINGDGNLISAFVIALRPDKIAVSIHPNSDICAKTSEGTVGYGTQRIDFSNNGTAVWLCAGYGSQALLFSADGSRQEPTVNSTWYADVCPYNSNDCTGIKAADCVVVDYLTQCRAESDTYAAKGLAGQKNFVSADFYWDDSGSSCAGSPYGLASSNSGYVCTTRLGEGSIGYFYRNSDNTSANIFIQVPTPTPGPTLNPNATATPSPTPTATPFPPNNVSVTCFAAEMTVMVLDGTVKRMDQLEIGDKVQVRGGRYSEVYFFGHRDASVVNPSYVELKVGLRDKPLVISEDHYLWANDQWMLAGNVKVGDQLIADAHLVEVVSIKRVARKGLYNPHTLEGSIVVNGVLASSYNRILHPALAHWLLGPERFIYQWSKFSLLGTMLDNEAPLPLKSIGWFIHGISK